ncbi:hypothetical protein M758_8G130600 [Ceratodon purpureus]|uniref:SEC7 domain-containing protein n=1 Tax=Ceratodon purpureus TaxID=3225 RepID=A0A8T0H325_CERPU|nr:hypothetical protein KC19_8G135600 [Ceratodon purpureus]KAG0608765.1 hypothetical protein M758_8G130600 [Ceratodon purpureus]
MGRSAHNPSESAMEGVGSGRAMARRSGGALACMVNAEVSAVLAAMRRNVRWQGRYMASDDQMEHPIIRSLKSLRRRVFSWQQQQSWQSINPSFYLSPFLDVIRSDETGAAITGIALSAVYKIVTLEVFNVKTAHVDVAMHMIVDAVTSCRFEVTDPASEEVVLMKILQVLLACLKCGAGAVLSNRDVCNVLNTTFRVVHQAGSKGELLQRTARHTMHELVRAVFSHLSSLEATPALITLPSNSLEAASSNGAVYDKSESSVGNQVDGNGDLSHFEGLETLSGNASEEGSSRLSYSGKREEANSRSVVVTDQSTAIEPYGIPCMVEIFNFLCSLLNIADPQSPGQALLASDEDVPHFALLLINSSIELGGESFSRHPKLLALVQDELFRNLMLMGLSPNALVLSMVCGIVLNLYHHLRSAVKLQLEAFFSYILIRLASGKYGASHQQQEVAMEALVDFCRQPTFMPEMYANFDCDITLCNTFEDLGNLLSKSAFPVNCPLSAMHVLALEGILAVVHSMADRVDSAAPALTSSTLSGAMVAENQDYVPFWTLKCENYQDPGSWIEYVKHQKYIKRRLMIGADHFNRDPKKGLEFLQGIRLLPAKLDPKSVACFFRYTTGLNKDLLGDFLGDPDEFCLQVLEEFARTFDFSDMQIDGALRTFLESFRLPGEAQKIHRVLEAFSDRFYQQSKGILANKDAAFVLSYSVIMLNTDQHNVQVRKKMTEEDFIKNLRNINDGQDLPRPMLSELYHNIVRSEIRITYDSGAGVSEMTHSRWVDLMRRSMTTTPYITCDSRPLLDHDMFAIISGPTIAAISVVFDHAEDEEVLRSCVEGFLAVAKISASHRLQDVLDDLVVSLCKFTTLLNPTASAEEPVVAFGDDTKARMAAITVFSIANKFGDFIRTAWRNILDCILRLHKLGLLPSRIASDAAEDTDLNGDSAQGKLAGGALGMASMPLSGNRRRSTGLMSRFSQLLSLDADEPRSAPTEHQLAAQQRTLRTIESCHIDQIFTDSKFLQSESLLQLARALVWAAGRPQKNGGSSEDEDTAVFCLELLFAITLNNRDRIMLLWQGVYEHMAGIVQTTVVPGLLVEKAVFGLLRICQRLLPYKEELAEELLRSLQLILKLDARVADAFCERITQEVMVLVRANAGHIKSPMGWRTVSSLLSITARHPEASDPGFEALTFIMQDGAHLTPANYVLCLDAARAFAEARVGGSERSIRALDLLSDSVGCLTRWSKAKSASTVVSSEVVEGFPRFSQELAEMWLRLAQGLRRVCLEQREEVRNYAIVCLQRCLGAADSITLTPTMWVQSFEQVVLTLLDELLDIAVRYPPKEFRGMEITLMHALKFLSKFYLQFLDHLAQLPTFRTIWSQVLNRIEMYMKAKLRSRNTEKLQELVPELLQEILQVMYSRKFLVKTDSPTGDSLWELTWQAVQNISPALKPDILKEPEPLADSKVDPDESPKAEPVAELDTADSLPAGDQGTEEHKPSEEIQ